MVTGEDDDDDDDDDDDNDVIDDNDTNDGNRGMAQMMPCARSRLMYMNASLLPLSVPIHPGSFRWLFGCSCASPSRGTTTSLHRSAEGCVADSVSEGTTPAEFVGARR